MEDDFSDDDDQSLPRTLGIALRGEECDSFEVLDIGFDEAFSRGAFVLDLPGVRFKEIDRD